MGPSSERKLVATSVELIAANQVSSGAYVAAPGYDTYAYCWLRDGAFIASAMDACGRRESATAFHRWVARTVEAYGHKVRRLEATAGERSAVGPLGLRPLSDAEGLHTRFGLEGEEAQESWGNVQLDGYGYWLTSLSEHLAAHDADPAPFVGAVDLIRRYLCLTWDRPCYDCWEEYPTRRHPTTWAAVARGLVATAEIGSDSGATEVGELIARRLRTETRPNHVLRKFVDDPWTDAEGAPSPSDDRPRDVAVAGHERVGRRLAADAVDGSALLVLGPFGPFGLDDPIVGATLDAVGSTLVADGGVHRYLEDDYYGGGLWVVLAGALAISIADRDPDRSADVLRWIEAQAADDGTLPEQVASHLRQPAMYRPWVKRWGQPARPLLWSHAMYLLGVAAVDGSD